MAESDDAHTIKFISDEAAEQDFFGSHKPVADAIASVIEAEPRLKVVGLLGPWGSGKSTVLRILKNNLAADDNKRQDIRFFIYDAWAHQSDPPRRSFLETLIGFLVNENLTTKEEWQDDLDRLNRRIEEHDTQSTPTLTFSGKIIGIMLLLFPIGLVLISQGWQGKCVELLGYELSVNLLGVMFLVAPIVAGVFVYLSWRQCFNPFNAAFWSSTNWSKHRYPHHKSTIFSIFVNRSTDHVVNRIIRSPDPTAIEFQEAYHRIMTKVSQSGRRFVFVVDNLDRIPEREAVTLWSTIRSFFLSRTNEVVPSGQNFRPPIVILPLDPTAVRRMYGVNQPNGDELAQSFLDKTFDLIFRVAPPVLSDWQSYLENKLKEAFGSLISSDDIYITTKLYATSLLATANSKSRGQVVTPRTIIKLVNLMITLRLQHGVEVPFSSIAYYAIYKEDIESDISSILDRTDVEISWIDPDWRRAVTAIYYNVPLEKSLQVLMLPLLQSAISAANKSEFSKLVSVPGFEALLEQAVEEMPAPAGPQFIVSVAYLMRELGMLPSPRFDAIHRRLRNALEETQPWSEIPGIAGTGIAALVGACPVGEGRLLVERLASSLLKVAADLNTMREGISNWTNAAASLFVSAKEKSFNVPKVTVPGSAAAYFGVLEKASANPALLKVLASESNDNAIIQTLTEMATTTNFAAPIESQVRLLLATGHIWPWSGFITAAGKFVQEQNASDVGTAVAMRVLGMLRSVNGAAELSRLSTEGILFDKLHQAHAGKLNEAEAAILVGLILNNPGLAKGAVVGNGEAGYQLIADLDKSLSDRPTLEPLIDAQLAAFGDFKELVDAAQKAKGLRSLVKRIFSARVRGGRIGPLHINDVVARLNLYLDLLEPDQQKEFLLKIPTYSTFWDEFKAVKLGDNLYKLFAAFIECDDETGKLSSR